MAPPFATSFSTGTVQLNPPTQAVPRYKKGAMSHSAEDSIKRCRNLLGHAQLLHHGSIRQRAIADHTSRTGRYSPFRRYVYYRATTAESCKACYLITPTFTSTVVRSTKYAASLSSSPDPSLYALSSAKSNHPLCPLRTVYHHGCYAHQPQTGKSKRGQLVDLPRTRTLQTSLYPLP